MNDGAPFNANKNRTVLKKIENRLPKCRNVLDDVPVRGSMAMRLPRRPVAIQSITPSLLASTE